MMRKVLCLLLVFVCFALSASAEIQLLPPLKQWDLSMPMEINLSADVKTHMPFDDERCAQLNALLKHVSLRLGISQEENASFSRLAVCVDGNEALRVLQKDANGSGEVQLSWLEGMTIKGGSDVLNQLLGQEDAQFSLYGLTGGETVWLDEGALMLGRIGEALQSFGKEATIKTAIKNMGTARKKITYTIPKDQTEVFAKAIAEHCQGEELRKYLTQLTFSGKQKLILWLTDDGSVIRAEYAGQCGRDEANLRQVSLKWRMRRDDAAIRDEITLKTPAVKGTDYNTVTFSRDIAPGKNKSIVCEMSLEENVKADKQKSGRSARVMLTSRPQKDAYSLTGEITVTRQLPGEDTTSSVVIQPDLVLGCDEGTPLASGTISVQEMRGKKTVVEDACIRLDAGAGTFVEWEKTDKVCSLNEFTMEDIAGFSEKMAADLLMHLVLLPEEDTLYLSADLPQESWQHIVQAARSALPEEVVR